MSKLQVTKTKFYIQNNWTNFNQKGKINPKELGWVRPDGVINFQIPDAAENYAKKKCVDALNSVLPFERGVLVKDNQILAEVEGDISRVDMSEYRDKGVGAVFYHGHTRIRNYPESPLSLVDYLGMLTMRLKKVVAFNKNGEHSTLLQNPDKNRFIKYLPQEYQGILIKAKQIRKGKFAVSEYGKEYSKHFPKKLQKKMEYLIHSHVGVKYGNRNKILALRKNILSFTFDECLEIDSVADYLKANGTISKIINNFWEKISKKINCIYETNFSDLTKNDRL